MSERPPPAAPARQSMAKVVGEKIRGQILDGKLRPGERLVEDRLSAELGVSRVPVREALRELSAEGLVRIERNRGASVTEVTPAMVAELVEVRALLEGLNARLAAKLTGWRVDIRGDGSSVVEEGTPETYSAASERDGDGVSGEASPEV